MIKSTSNWMIKSMIVLWRYDDVEIELWKENA